MHRVQPIVLDVAERAATSIRRFYVAGGGSTSDFRTDLASVIEAVLTFGELQPHVLERTPRVVETSSYTGPDRRRTGKRAWA